MDINTITPSTPSAAPQTSSAVTDSTVLSSDFETFLKMLTAQARYQDPLEPVDSTEYASQLAQFSAVEQQVKSNDLLSAIAGQIGTGNLAELAGWIGMEARTTSPVYVGANPVTLLPNPATVADEAWLIARNQQGDEVSRTQIPVSSEPLSWVPVDSSGGALPAGTYSFEVESRAQGEVIRTDTPASYARITEARNEGGKTMLILEGGIPITANEVTALRSGA